MLVLFERVLCVNIAGIVIPKRNFGAGFHVRTIIMSPMNARRALLVQQWLVYNACVQMPHE